MTLPEIDETKLYTIDSIVEEKLLYDEHNEPMTYWKVRALFKRGVLKKANISGDGRKTFIVSGINLKKYREEVYA